MAEGQRTKRRERTREWSDAELIMFSIAVFVVFIMTLSRVLGFAAMLDGGEEEPPTNVVTVENGANQQGGGENGEDQQGNDAPDADLGYDLTQYASDTGAAGKLYAHMEQYPEAAYILRNIDHYPQALLEFAARFPEAMSYAASYLDYDRMNLSQEIDLTAEGNMLTVPLLLQWDSRWGYQSYGDGLIGYTGCGPTCLSMVSLYLNGFNGNDPVSIARYAEENGYYVEGSGSSWTLMSKASANFGLSAKEVILDENAMVRALEADKPIICAMGPGAFTDNGHYIVLTGYKDGAFTICDPNSPANSARTWTFSELKGEIRNIWSFTKA